MTPATRPPLAGDAVDRRIEAEFDAAPGGVFGQRLVNLCASPDSSGWCVVAAGQPLAGAGQRRLDLDAALGADRFAVEIPYSHGAGRIHGPGKGLRVSVTGEGRRVQMVISARQFAAEVCRQPRL